MDHFKIGAKIGLTKIKKCQYLHRGMTSFPTDEKIYSFELRQRTYKIEPTEKQERRERATSDTSTTTRKSTERGTYNQINAVDIKN